MRAHYAAWLERLAWAAIAVGGGVLVVVSFIPRRSPEARDPRWTLFSSEDDYDFSRGLAGWTILAVTTQLLVWLTGYRALRLGLAPLPALAMVGGATVVFWAWWFFHAFEKTA